PEPNREPCFWRTCIDGNLSDETESLLKETTDWEKRGYLYFSTWQPSYGVRDRIVFFDLNTKCVSIVEIKEMTQTPRRTPDGSHFAAYRRVRGVPLRKLIPKRWKLMKAAGLIRRKDDAYSSRKLKPRLFERFVENLKITAK